VTPNYKFVVGAVNNDGGRPRPAADYSDFEDYPEAKEESRSPEELYALCVREVPAYLRQELCSHVLATKPESRHSDDDVEYSDEALPQHVETSVERTESSVVSSVSVYEERLPSKDIPMELPKQTKQRQATGVKESPVAAAAKAMVKVYTPAADSFRSTTTSTSTTTTTTTIPTTTTTFTTPTTTTTTPHTSTSAEPTSFSSSSSTTTTTTTEKSSENSSHVEKDPESPADRPELKLRRRPPPPPPQGSVQSAQFLEGLAHFLSSSFFGPAPPPQRRKAPAKSKEAEQTTAWTTDSSQTEVEE
jgi:hypothetical protein